MQILVCGLVEHALAGEEPVFQPTSPVPEQPPSSKPAIEPTSREVEVAVLASRGLTNRQIASQLMLSELTAAKKLRLHSRTQVAAWFTEQH